MKTAARCELFCCPHMITGKEDVCKWVSHRDSHLEGDADDLPVFSKTSCLTAILPLELCHKNNSFHKLHCTHDRYFGCPLLPIQSSWRSRTVALCLLPSTAGSLFGTLRWQQFTMIKFASAKLRIYYIHIYYAVDSELFQSAITVFLTMADKSSLHPPKALHPQTWNARSQSAMAKTSAARRCLRVPWQNNVRVSGKLLCLQK